MAINKTIEANKVSHSEDGINMCDFEPYRAHLAIFSNVS